MALILLPPALNLLPHSIRYVDDLLLACKCALSALWISERETREDLID
jgi:hypothetical protein